MAKIKDPDEVQFRQVNPKWIDEGVPTREAFLPMGNDDGKLSLQSLKIHHGQGIL